MTSNLLPSSVRTVLACLLLAVGLTFGAAAVGSVSSAGAQAATVDPNDFIDPVTGQFDIEAYLAALAAANANAGSGASGATSGATGTTGSLPTTGSSTIDFAGLGIAFIVVGGAGVWAARRNQPQAVAAADTPAAD